MLSFSRIAGLLALLGNQCTMFDTPAKADDRLIAHRQTYADRFIPSDGRVIDNANRNVSHSEGQGYAMLLAERLDDRDTFAKIWGWSEQHLFIRRDALAAWRWGSNSEPNVTDDNNATDGDLLIAWALSNAATRWNVAGYADAGRRIADALATEVIASSRFGAILLPAAKGFGSLDQRDRPVINLSYWVLPSSICERYLAKRIGMPSPGPAKA